VRLALCYLPPLKSELLTPLEGFIFILELRKWLFSSCHQRQHSLNQTTFSTYKYIYTSCTYSSAGWNSTASSIAHGWYGMMWRKIPLAFKSNPVLAKVPYKHTNRNMLSSLHADTSFTNSQMRCCNWLLQHCHFENHHAIKYESTRRNGQSTDLETFDTQQL